MTDRLWTRPATLTPDERALARLAYEQAPTLLDDAVLAALGHIADGEAQVAGMLARIRGTRCTP
jgi:hypothetical protein